MIRMAVSGEDIIGALNGAQHGLFVRFPFFARTIRLFTGKKRIDDNNCLPDLNLPTGGPEPFDNEASYFGL